VLISVDKESKWYQNGWLALLSVITLRKTPSWGSIIKDLGSQSDSFASLVKADHYSNHDIIKLLSRTWQLTLRFFHFVSLVGWGGIFAPGIMTGDIWW
jgi:hypothetical protein